MRSPRDLLRHRPRAARLAGTPWGIVLREAYDGFWRHRPAQNAAAISFRVLFSLVPLVALITAVVDVLIPAQWRADVTEWLNDALSGSTELQNAVDRSLAHSGVSASVAGLVALAGLLWTATGMMASFRFAFDEIWELPGSRPFVRGKLLDAALVFGAAVLLLAGFVVSILVRGVTDLADKIRVAVGVGVSASIASGLAAAAGTLVLTTLALVVLYRVAAPVAPRWRDVWPGAIVGGAGIEIATIVYGWYLSEFSSLSLVYGSLGAVLGFLLVVYWGAYAMLVGAELVAARSRRPAAAP